MLFLSVCPAGSVKESFRLTLAGMCKVTLKTVLAALFVGSSASTWLVSGENWRCRFKGLGLDLTGIRVSQSARSVEVELAPHRKIQSYV